MTRLEEIRHQYVTTGVIDDDDIERLLSIVESVVAIKASKDLASQQYQTAYLNQELEDLENPNGDD